MNLQAFLKKKWATEWGGIGPIGMFRAMDFYGQLRGSREKGIGNFMPFSELC